MSGSPHAALHWRDHVVPTAGCIAARPIDMIGLANGVPVLENLPRAQATGRGELFAGKETKRVGARALGSRWRVVRAWIGRRNSRWSLG